MKIISFNRLRFLKISRLGYADSAQKQRFWAILHPQPHRTLMTYRRLRIDVNKYKLYFQSNKHNVMCMFLNRKKVIDIFNEYIHKNNINITTYDLIISMRCDLIFDTPIDLYKYIPYIKNDILIAPDTFNNFGGVDDRFTLGNYSIISKYLNLYDNLIILLDNGNIIHPEMLTLKNLELQNIRLQKMPFNFDINRKLMII